jgi:hypothetical protein
MTMARYDPDKLDDLGERRRQLRAELKEVNDLIAAEIPKAVKAGIIQAEIARRTGMTRESVAQLGLPPGQRWGRAKRDTDKS